MESARLLRYFTRMLVEERKFAEVQNQLARWDITITFLELFETILHSVCMIPDASVDEQASQLKFYDKSLHSP